MNEQYFFGEQYVFRGQEPPFAPDPQQQRERAAAIREAEELAHRAPPTMDASLFDDVELREKIEDYQVGGWDSYGALS